MTELVKQYLDSGTIEISLEQSTSLDLVSYIYSRFGTFRIIPVTGAIQTFNSLEKYQIFLDTGLIGEVQVNITGGSIDVALAMSNAINIVTAKINELVNTEERSVLASLLSNVVQGINLSEEQKAMYRSYLIENGKLDAVLEEIDSPTDILGDAGG